MLESDELPIDEIAEEVGYSDLASFRRLFRRLSGLTPSEYRRRFRLPDNVAVVLNEGVPLASRLVAAR